MQGEVNNSINILNFVDLHRMGKAEKIRGCQSLESGFENGVFVINHSNFNGTVQNVTKNHHFVVLYHRDDQDIVEVYEQFVN